MLSNYLNTKNSSSVKFIRSERPHFAQGHTFISCDQFPPNSMAGRRNASRRRGSGAVVKEEEEEEAKQQKIVGHICGTASTAANGPSLRQRRRYERGRA